MGEGDAVLPAEALLVGVSGADGDARDEALRTRDIVGALERETDGDPDCVNNSDGDDELVDVRACVAEEVAEAESEGVGLLVLDVEQTVEGDADAH